MEYSREKYRSPFLAILEAWRLECAPGERDLRVEPLDLPPPRYVAGVGGVDCRGTSLRSFLSCCA